MKYPGIFTILAMMANLCVALPGESHAAKLGESCKEYGIRQATGKHYVSESGFCMAEMLTCDGRNLVAGEYDDPAPGKCPGGRKPSCPRQMLIALTIPESMPVKKVMEILEELSGPTFGFYNLNIHFGTSHKGTLVPWKIGISATPWFEHENFAHEPIAGEFTREEVKAGLEKKFPGILNAVACPGELEIPSVVGSN